MKKLIYWIGFLVIVIIIIIKVFFSNQKQESQVTIFEFENGEVGESVDVPTGKYPHGFPIEILKYKDQVIEGQRYISGYCRWHPEADPSVGGNIAVVPVIIGVRIEKAEDCPERFKKHLPKRSKQKVDKSTT